MDTLETYYLLTAKTSSWRKYCVTSKKSAYFSTFDRLFKSYFLSYIVLCFLYRFQLDALEQLLIRISPCSAENIQNKRLFSVCLV